MADVLSILVRYLYKIKITQLEMIRDRGYIIPEKEEKYLLDVDENMEERVYESINELIGSEKKGIKELLKKLPKTKEEQKRLARERFVQDYVKMVRSGSKNIYELLTQSYFKADGSCVLVCYAQPPADGAQLGLDALSMFIEMMTGIRNCKHLIIISAVNLTSPAGKKLKEYPAYRIEFFLEKQLTFNLTKHVSVPKHRALSAEEMREMVKSQKLDLEQFPIILTTDAVSRYYGFQVGQLVEIERINRVETMARESKFYRMVVQPTYDVEKLEKENKHKVESKK